jgi:hypothetical protein
MVRRLVRSFRADGPPSFSVIEVSYFEPSRDQQQNLKTQSHLNRDGPYDAMASPLLWTTVDN